MCYKNHVLVSKVIWKHHRRRFFRLSTLWLTLIKFECSPKKKNLIGHSNFTYHNLIILNLLVWFIQNFLTNIRFYFILFKSWKILLLKPKAFNWNWNIKNDQSATKDRFEVEAAINRLESRGIHKILKNRVTQLGLTNRSFPTIKRAFFSTARDLFLPPSRSAPPVSRALISSLDICVTQFRHCSIQW